MLLPHDLPPIKSVRKIARLTSVDLTSPFHLPSALNADRPPERRGLARDRVRLLVLDRYTGNVTHTRFDRIASANVQELTDDERQQLAQEGAADGKNTALKDVQLLKPFGNFGSMENAEKPHIPSSVDYIYSTAFDEAYKETYYTEGQKIAGPLPEQHTMGDVDEVNAVIKSHLKPTDDFEFQSASKFGLTTLHGKPVWKIDQYSVIMTGYDSPTFTVIVENGKIRFVSGPSFSATVSFPSN